MTVNQDSKRLAIDWSGFDIANDERVTFRQPDKDSVALNRVVGDAASVIDGTLSGNGHVYVINPNGVLFGKNASVDVGSLVASTARISDSDMTNFANADGITMAIPEDSSAKVINAGTIRAEGGLVVLHAAEVENSGTITNPEGTTALAAARNLSLSADTAGKINFTVDRCTCQGKGAQQRYAQGRWRLSRHDGKECRRCHEHGRQQHGHDGSKDPASEREG